MLTAHRPGKRIWWGGTFARSHIRTLEFRMFIKSDNKKKKKQKKKKKKKKQTATRLEEAVAIGNRR